MGRLPKHITGKIDYPRHMNYPKKFKEPELMFKEKGEMYDM